MANIPSIFHHTCTVFHCNCRDDAAALDNISILFVYEFNLQLVGVQIVLFLEPECILQVHSIDLVVLIYRPINLLSQRRKWKG